MSHQDQTPLPSRFPMEDPAAGEEHTQQPGVPGVMSNLAQNVAVGLNLGQKGAQLGHEGVRASAPLQEEENAHFGGGYIEEEEAVVGQDTKEHDKDEEVQAADERVEEIVRILATLDELEKSGAQLVRTIRDALQGAPADEWVMAEDEILKFIHDNDGLARVFSRINFLRDNINDDPVEELWEEIESIQRSLLACVSSATLHIQRRTDAKASLASDDLVHINDAVKRLVDGYKHRLSRSAPPSKPFCLPADDARLVLFMNSKFKGAANRVRNASNNLLTKEKDLLICDSNRRGSTTSAASGSSASSTDTTTTLNAFVKACDRSKGPF